MDIFDVTSTWPDEDTVVDTKKCDENCDEAKTVAMGEAQTLDMNLTSTFAQLANGEILQYPVWNVNDSGAKNLAVLLCKVLCPITPQRITEGKSNDQGAPQR